MMKNENLCVAGVTTAAVGIGGSVPALSGVVAKMVTSAGYTHMGNAVTISAGLANTALGTLGVSLAPWLIVGGVVCMFVFGSEK